MLSFEEFKDVNHIVLDKANYTYVMNYGITTWKIVTIPKNTNEDITEEYMYDEAAYDFYRERMESYGFKQFPILVE